MERNVTRLFEDFREGRKRFAVDKKDKQGNEPPTVAKYKDLIEKKDKLFDCATDVSNKKEKCIEQWKVKMGDMEYKFLEDQRGERVEYPEPA